MARKQFVSLVLAIVLVCTLALSIAGCAPAPSTAPPTTTPTPPVQPKELRMATFASKTVPQMTDIQAFCDNVAKYTNGTVKIKIYGVGEIAETKDLPELTRTGSIDMSLTAPVYYPSLFPLNGALQQMLIINKTPDQAIYTWRNLFKEFPEIQKEYAGQNQYVLNRASLGTYYTLSKTPIRSGSDLQGMKVRQSGGKFPGELVAASGATPVFVPPADYYESLMRGVIEAFNGDLQIIVGYKLYESAKYLGWPQGTMVGWHIAMNLDVWKSLTPDQQKALTRAVTEWGAADLKRQLDFEKNGVEMLKAKGVEYIPFPDKDWAPIMAKFGDSWVLIEKYMVNDLKLDAAFSAKFVKRWHELNDEYDAKYLQTGKTWTYE